MKAQITRYWKLSTYMANKNKTLLFDFDGVIVDTFEIAYGARKELTPNLDKESYSHLFDGNIYEEKEPEDLENSHSKVDENDPFFKTYTPLLMKQRPVSGMTDVIKELHKDHRMVVISSTISSPIKDYLNKYDLSLYFDKIYGGDVHKSKTLKVKMAFAEFNLIADDCLFITDTLGDMREAAKVGVTSIGVTWGFQRRDTLQKGNPIAIVSSPQELLSVIKK